jgi:hypothetical protein
MKASSFSSCLIAATSVACSEGYPTSDSTHAANARPQTPQAVVASLNRLGVNSDASTRWQYQFLDPCTLSVSRDGKPAQATDLRGHWVHTRSGGGTGPHKVTLELLRQPDSAEVMVFTATEWRDALEAAGAIKQLSASCPR